MKGWLYSYRYVCGDELIIAEYLSDHSVRVVRYLERVNGSRLHRYAVAKGGVDGELLVKA